MTFNLAHEDYALRPQVSAGENDLPCFSQAPRPLVSPYCLPVTLLYSGEHRRRVRFDCVEIAIVSVPLMEGMTHDYVVSSISIDIGALQTQGLEVLAPMPGSWLIGEQRFAVELSCTRAILL